ncbi:hypothetical protein [Streptomyces sp. URMC 123]|uniref:SCO2584 family spore wall biosynthesis protein n=1 Tax=Streptomyces sp. URMC 123 TaxID=3423403 RepID=UPI003F1D66BD
MPDDVGGRPFPDGDEPDSRDHGAADDAFASVVFDEEFVRSAAIHEPTAVERILAAAQARAEAETSRSRGGGGPPDEDFYEDAYGPDAGLGRDRREGRAEPERGADDALHGPYGRYGGALGPYRPHRQWHRPVAWVLAVLMGVGMVALAFAAVYRGSSGGRQSPAPPTASTGVDAPGAESAPGAGRAEGPDQGRAGEQGPRHGPERPGERARRPADGPVGPLETLPSASPDFSPPTASAAPRSP